MQRLSHPPARRVRRRHLLVAALLGVTLLVIATASLTDRAIAYGSNMPRRLGVLHEVPPRNGSPLVEPILIDLEERTFRFFWDTANPKNGLIPDRYPTPSFASIAAVGFGLTSYPIGVERGYITRKKRASGCSPRCASCGTRRRARTSTGCRATRASSITSST